MKGEEIWSESVYLDAVSPDGTHGFFARLCRYPSAGIAWVWAHVFTPDGCLSYNESTVACGNDAVAVEAPDVTYATASGDVAFRRDGARDAIERGSLSLHVHAHEGPTAPDRVGSVPLAIEASFTPSRGFQGAGNLPGRTEECGTVSVRASWPVGGLDLTAYGQWHEQHQDAPRFSVPFTYLSLRGDEASLVAVVWPPNHAAGIFRRASTGEHALGARVEPPGDERAVSIELVDGSTVTGSLRATYRFAVPIYGHPRLGTLVTGTLDGSQVSGYLNDWDPEP